MAVCEHPARIPTASNATITTDNLSFFIFLLYEFEMESQTAMKRWLECCLCIPRVHPSSLETKITFTLIRTARCESNRPEPPISPVPNPLQPKRVFSAVDRVFPAPTAELWAVRSGPPVSVALADSAGLWVSAPEERASADRYVAGCDFLDLTFYFLLCWSFCCWYLISIVLTVYACVSQRSWYRPLSSGSIVGTRYFDTDEREF